MTEATAIEATSARHGRSAALTPPELKGMADALGTVASLPDELIRLLTDVTDNVQDGLTQCVQAWLRDHIVTLTNRVGPEVMAEMLALGLDLAKREHADRKAPEVA